MSDKTAPSDVNAPLRRMTGAQRRESIVEAAIVEFTRVGYQGSTIAKIAAAAGCSEPNLYKYFRDKRGLLMACLEHTETVAEAELDRVALEPEPLPAFLALIRESHAYRRMLMLRMLCTTVRDDEELLEHLRGGTGRLLQRWSIAIERGQAAGRMSPDIDARHVGWTWLGLAMAACHAALLNGTDAFDEVLDVGERYLRGVFES